MSKALLLTTAILLATPAYAMPWLVDVNKSKLTFEAKQAGEAFEGEFKRFTPSIDFDPSHPETGKITVTIDMKSATTADKERAEALPTKDWFAVATNPTAEFKSVKITGLGNNQFIASGNLTIRGVTKPVNLPFTLKPEGPATKAEGSLTLDRSDYGVGQGEWKDGKWIDLNVTVKYVIYATPGK